MRHMRIGAALATLVVLGGCIRDRAEVSTITLDYLTSSQAVALAEPYLSADGKLFVSDAALNTITVRDREKNVRRIRNMLNERDASPQNVSLHFQVVRATEHGAMDPQLARIGGALRELLRFEGYELVGQAVVSAAERRVVQQSVSGGAFPLQLGLRINDVVGGSGSVDMEVDLRREGYPSLLATNVVIPMGQTVVLGSAFPGASGEALILTVRGERGSRKLRTSSRERVEDIDDVHDHVAEEVAAAAAADAAMAAEEHAVSVTTGRTKSAVTASKTRGGNEVVHVIVPPTKSAVSGTKQATTKARPVPPR